MVRQSANIERLSALEADGNHTRSIGIAHTAQYTHQQWLRRGEGDRLAPRVRRFRLVVPSPVAHLVRVTRALRVLDLEALNAEVLEAR